MSAGPNATDEGNKKTKVARMMVAVVRIEVLLFM